MYQKSAAVIAFVLLVRAIQALDRGQPMIGIALGAIATGLIISIVWSRGSDTMKPNPNRAESLAQRLEGRTDVSKAILTGAKYMTQTDRGHYIYERRNGATEEQIWRAPDGTPVRLVYDLKGDTVTEKSI